MRSNAPHSRDLPSSLRAPSSSPRTFWSCSRDILRPVPSPARLTDQHCMYRLFLASTLFGAIVALPAPAAAQIGSGGCRMVSFGSVDLINKEKDPTLATGSTRREARSSETVPVEIRCGEVLLI